jgi:PhoH-like ATPase
LDKDSNGLVFAATKFLNSKLSAHVVLKKGERSPLATEAAKLL